MININKRAQISDFWYWFDLNKYHYEHLDDWDPELNLLFAKMKAIDHELFVEMVIEARRGHERELIITADANIEKFPIVKEIVKAAPEIVGWKIIPFHQPQSLNFTISYKKFDLDPSKMYFFSFFLEDKLTIILYAENVKDISENDSLYLGRFILMDIIGEFHFATKVTYCYLEDISKADLDSIHPLTQFKTFIENMFINNN